MAAAVRTYNISRAAAAHAVGALSVQHPFDIFPRPSVPVFLASSYASPAGMRLPQCYCQAIRRLPAPSSGAYLYHQDKMVHTLLNPRRRSHLRWDAKNDQL